MSNFEPYSADGVSRPRLHPTIRPATVDDAPTIAAISAEREGRDAAEVAPAVRRSLEIGDVRVLVAEMDGRVRAFAKVAWLDREIEASRGACRDVIDGYYLSGIVVEPAWRRRGVGDALTAARLRWVEDNGGTEALYRANLRNRTSIALHARFGFEEATRSAEYASMPSTPGERYAVYRAPLVPELPLRLGAKLPIDAVMSLYDAVGWTAYTRDPRGLVRALSRSTWVATRWRDDALIALCRVVSDEASIATVQDLLVHPTMQRRGIGKSLLRLALDRFTHVRHVVLLTDDRPEQRAFYERVGLSDLARQPLRCFVRLQAP